MKRGAMAACVLAIVILATGFWSYQGSPSYSLRQIERAIEHGNRLQFQQYVDLERFLPAAVDQLVGRSLLEQARDQDATGFEALGGAFGSALVEQFKPALVQNLRRAVLEGVENGRVQEIFSASDSAAAGGIDLSEVGASSGLNPNAFAGIDRLIKEGNDALVGFRFRQEHLDTTLILQVRMERTDRRWIVVEPEDLDSYMAKVEELRSAHLSVVNEEQRAEVRRILRLGTPTRQSERLFRFTTYDIRVPLTNAGMESVHLRFAWMVPPGGSTEERELLLSDRDLLQPGDSTSLRATLIDGLSTQIPDVYRTGDLASLDIDVSFVIGDSGTARYVGPYRDWQSYLDRLDDPTGYADRILAARVQRGDDDPDDLLGREATGPWLVSEDSNPLDDSSIVTLINSASEGRSRFGDAPSLVMRCQNNTTEVYINWNDYLGSDGPVVSYRVGDGPMQRRTWSISTSNRATFYPGNDVQLVRELIDASRFVARVTPYNESPVTAVFEMDGLETHVSKLQAACKWE